MKKLVLIFVAVAFAACGSDDGGSSAGTNFSVDGTNLELLPQQGIVEQRFTGSYTFNDQAYTRSQITISGINGQTSTGTVSFDLFYPADSSIAGTYQINNDEDEVFFDDFLAQHTRGCEGWTSMASTFLLTGSMEQANDPEGTVTVTANSSTNYTVQYSGNFRQFDGDFNIVGTMPVSVNVAGEVYLQSN